MWKGKTLFMSNVLKFKNTNQNFNSQKQDNLSDLNLSLEHVLNDSLDKKSIKKTGILFTECSSCGFTTPTDLENRCHYCFQTKRQAKRTFY
jgi:hypothetical protein